MKIFHLLTIVAMALGALPSTAEESREEKGRIYFAQYLANCPATQIRCVWHSQSYRAGQIMEIDLKNCTVFTDTRVLNWADQNMVTRKLSHYQILTLKEIIDEMPASTDSSQSLKCVYISYQHESKVEIRRYLRSKLPREVQRIYDIGGDYIETKNPGEQDGAGQPATRPESKSEGSDKPQPESEGRSR